GRAPRPSSPAVTWTVLVTASTALIAPSMVATSGSVCRCGGHRTDNMLNRPSSTPTRSTRATTPRRPASPTFVIADTMATNGYTPRDKNHEVPIPSYPRIFGTGPRSNSPARSHRLRSNVQVPTSQRTCGRTRPRGDHEDSRYRNALRRHRPGHRANHGTGGRRGGNAPNAGDTGAGSRYQ